MDRKNPQKFFDEWLSAYTGRLHMIRQGMHIDFVQPKEEKPPLHGNRKKKADTTHKHKPAGA